MPMSEVMCAHTKFINVVYFFNLIFNGKLIGWVACWLSPNGEV